MSPEEPKGGPVASVIVAVRNGAAHVAGLRAMFDAQIFRDFEVILVDDASEDGTADRLQDWSEHPAGATVTVLRLERQHGAAAARRRGLQVARGRWIWFADADDRFDPDLLEGAVTHAERHAADIVCFRARAEHEDGSPHPVVLYGRPAPTAVRIAEGVDAVDAVFSGEVMGYLWDKLFAREPLVRAFDESIDLRTHEDLLMLLGLLLERPRLVLVPGAPYVYVVRGATLSNTRTASFRDLERCAEAADRVASTGPAGIHYGTFLVRYVGLSALDDAARKGTPADVRDAAARLASRLRAASPREVARDHGWALAARATAARAAPEAYAGVYRSVRGVARAIREARR